MRVLAAALLLAALLPGSANAGPRADALIDQAATFVAGKPVDASCGASDAEWQAEVDRVFGPGRRVQAYAYVGSSAVRLHPWICRVLDGQPAGATLPGLGTVGAALNILAHEASHARGIVDEPRAACAGLRYTDDLALRLFALTPWHPRAQRYVAESRAAHATLPASSRTLCP